MAENVGVREGQVRTAIGVLGLFAASLWVASTHGGSWLAFGALVLAVVVFLSGTLLFCPLYFLFGHSTCR